MWAEFFTEEEWDFILAKVYICPKDVMMVTFGEVSTLYSHHASGTKII